ncbi:glycosyltransferase [Alphaproteobacteria bacterium]|nr:glycosyltransferase [Alphaproteobacteria bacterium]
MPAEAVLGPRCLVFRDKLLLPSEGFIPSHYISFDELRPVYVANELGWRSDILDAPKIRTVNGALGRVAFKQFGAGINPSQFADEHGHAPAVLHAHFGRGGALALPLARALGIPLYVTFHGGDATKETHQRRRLFRSIYQRRLAALQSYASGFLGVSDFVTHQLRAQGFPPEKLRTHYIGIGLDGQYKLRAPTARAADAPLLFVGRLVDKKGVDTLLMAMRQLPASHANIRLEIAGSGPEEARLRKMAADLPHVTFLGWQTPDELASRLATCSAMVVPSQKARNGDCEGLPTVVLEALRAGVPVIATRHAGIPEIIDDGETGICVEERDPAALALAIGRHYDMGIGAQNLVAAGQRRLRTDFDAAIQSRRLQDILQSRPFVT